SGWNVTGIKKATKSVVLEGIDKETCIVGIRQDKAVGIIGVGQQTGQPARFFKAINNAASALRTQRIDQRLDVLGNDLKPLFIDGIQNPQDTIGGIQIETVGHIGYLRRNLVEDIDVDRSLYDRNIRASLDPIEDSRIHDEFDDSTLIQTSKDIGKAIASQIHQAHEIGSGNVVAVLHDLLNHVVDINRAASARKFFQSIPQRRRIGAIDNACECAQRKRRSGEEHHPELAFTIEPIFKSIAGVRDIENVADAVLFKPCPE